MVRLFCIALGVFGLVLSANSAHAQFWAPPPVVWQQPAPVVWQQPAPVIVTQPVSPVIVSQRPVVVSPTPVTTFYRAPIIGYKPVRTTYTRRRPILGGTVTRYRYGFQRVAF
jgi:hypothetical protein